jgi:hypothetical protein
VVDIRTLARLGRIQGYCDAVIKTSEEYGSTECARLILSEATSVLKELRECSEHAAGDAPR